MQKDQVIAKVHQVVDQLNRMLKTSIEYPKVSFEDLGPRTAGVARIRRHEVVFHPAYMSHEHFEKETITHEVVHLFVPKVFPNFKQHHGPEFRRLMNAMGCTGNTYHNMGRVETTKRTRVVSRFEYVCGCEGKVFQISATIHNRIKAGQKRCCPTCKYVVRPK